jgi:riboflavin kinase / FMN adenylyltransferase
MRGETRPPLHRSLAAITSPGAIVALGNFDGVHVGHRTLLAHARARADELGAPLVVVSFFPPAKVLFAKAQFLTTEEEKHALLTEAGADAVVVVPFDRAFAATPATGFTAALAAVRPAIVVVGEDFRFGRAREGGLDLLRAAVSHLEVVALELADGVVAKSSAIRAALARGDVERAERLLGAPYRITGEVVRGDQRGRTVGFPTANVATDARKSLPIGVFAAAVDTPAGRFGGMANVGPRPTFPDGAPALEVHLFDADVDLYGRPITVHLLARLRPPRRFDGLEALTAQLRRDEADARAALAARPAPPPAAPAAGGGSRGPRA